MGMVTMDKILLFPVLIMRKENFLNKKECNEIVKISKKQNLKKHNELEGKSSSFHDLNSNFLIFIEKYLINKLLLCLDEYAEQSGLHTLDISNSWINKQNKDSVLKKHCHPGSIVSGVIFLKCDELSSKLYFYDPNPFNNFINYKKLTNFNYRDVSVKPNIGDLILFPSWLMHGSDNEKNKSNERIVLSFNTKYYENTQNK
jgi:uncharacterized protein (TIGR02466 family)